MRNNKGMKKENKNKNKKKSANEAIYAYKHVDANIKTDPDGSYTGVCIPDCDKPTQDADDL